MRAEVFKVARLLLAALLIASVVGCGFQLRGTADWPAALARLELGGPELRPSARLEILAFDEELRMLVAAAKSDKRENLMTVTVRYRVVIDGNAGEPATIIAERSYLLDPADVTGALAEERRLREGLLDDAAATLVRRLAASG